MKQQIALIFGGKSGEHDVSIKTAFSIMQSINYTKYDVTPVYITLDGGWLQRESISQQPIGHDLFTQFSSYVPLTDLIGFFREMDVAFPVVHGPNGEDGTLQGLLEMMSIPYVGSNVMGSSVGMDKVMMKVVYEQFGLPQGSFLSFTRQQAEENLADVVSSIEMLLTYPVFVKPANLGSSIGISKANNSKEVVQAVEEALRFDDKIVVESMIVGRELEIGVLGHNHLRTSEVGEVATSKDFYDYEAKYQNQDVTNLTIPAHVPVHVKERMSDLAKQAFRALGCSGLSRVDFFWDEENDTLYINEINTMPGFTPHSMYPMLFKEAGVSYTALIDALIGFAYDKHHEKNRKAITAMKPLEVDSK